MKLPLQSRWEALLLSYLLPGAGQWACGRRLRGLLWFLLFPLGLCVAGRTALDTRYATLWPTVMVLAGLAVAWLVMLVLAACGAPRATNAQNRKPAIAALLSAIIPSLGQFYNRQWFVGALFLVALLSLSAVGALLIDPSPLVPGWREVCSAFVWIALSVGSTVQAYAYRRARTAAGGRMLRAVIRAAALGLLLSNAFDFLARTQFHTFKVPTAAMEPTVRGASVRPADAAPVPSFWNGVADFLVRGERHVVSRARASGAIAEDHAANGNTRVFDVNGVSHTILTDMNLQFRPGDLVTNDQVLATGIRKAGDYVLVNKCAYRYERPQRGDIVVFRTSEIEHPRLQKDVFYIKRIAGLPHELVGIVPPYLYVNGGKQTEPGIFDDIANGRGEFGGYETAHPLANPPPFLGKDTDSILLDDDEYLLLGDNSAHSFDSRYYGPVPGRAIVGKVVRIYWPFDRAGIPP